jgi:hypothetical protein
MRKLLILSAAITGLCVVATSVPAGAADRKIDGLRNDEAVQIDLSAHRRRYAHRHRYYVRRHYYGPRYYGGPYYYPYAYRYPGYYSYGYAPYPYYYRRPGIYFGFGY